MTDLTEKCMELGKSCLKHTMELNELNMKTMNNLTKTNHFEDLLQTRKMEDVFKLQQQMMKEFSDVSTRYIKEFFDIMTKNSNEITEQFSSLASEFGNMAESAARSGAAHMKQSGQSGSKKD